MVTVAKYPTLGKTEDGGSHNLQFSIFGHISTLNEDIFIKFGTLIDIGDARVTVTQYPTFGTLQHGGGYKRQILARQWLLWPNISLFAKF